MPSFQQLTSSESILRISTVLLVCFLPLSGFAQQLSLPADECSLSTPGRCVVEIAKDQRGILTSPFRIKKKDLAWVAPLVAVTATAYVFDRKTLHNVSTDPQQVNAFQRASDFTGMYIPIAASGTALFAGIARHDDHLRETGLLTGMAIVDTQLFTTFLKFATDRVRPQPTGLATESGEFWADGNHAWSADSFPSGHTATAFAAAHVIADEYPGWKVKLAVYSLATATAFERVEGRKHFPSDTIVGGAVGYLIGGYVFNHHSTRSKTRVDFAPIMGRGGMGMSLNISR
jgi:membrane-associated phospholipid phosphatase